MGKIINIVLGLFAAIIGIILLVKWWDSFIVCFKAAVAAIFIVGGVVALIAGLSELKDEIDDKKEKKE